MILQNINDENKIFIDDSLDNILQIINPEENNYFLIKNNEKINKCFIILFSKENIRITSIDYMIYSPEVDILYFYDNDQLHMCDKLINDDEMLSLSLEIENNEFVTINITTMKLSKPLSEADTNGHK